MAVLSSVPFIQQSLDGGCGCDFDVLPRLMESCQITPPPEVVVGCEGKIYVAVGKNLDDGKSCLLWASKNFGTKRIFLLHVHQPAQLIPAMGGKFPANKLDAQEVNAHRDHEKRKMHKILNEYVSICAQHGVLAEKLYIEMDNIEKGIVELVAQHGIERLIMGSSIAGKSKINTVKSKKAIFVSQEAHKLCHIWFICKGCLIQTREGILENPEIRSCESSFSSSSSETSSVHHLLQSITGQSSPVQKFIHGDISHGRDISRVASLNGTRGTSMPRYRTEDVDEIEEMFNSMQQAMVEVENAKREAREELFKRRKAEKNALEAIQIAKESERLYSDLIKQNKEMKVLLSRNTSELDRIKKERDELKTALDQKMVLERQIADFERLFVSFRLERDKLQLENDNTVHEAQILGERGAAEATSSQGLQFFSFSEIGAATCNFDPRLIIGGGGYGTVYKGFLRNTDVAIKLLDTTSLQGCSEFQQEVDVLSGMRHPNLVTLIGTCPEAWSLVYEYLPNGNLKDRLACKENTSPLSWKSRIRIAAEICSALIFLHSYKPHGIVHGDLKPANVLLDANLISKLGNFGISRSLTDGETSTNSDIMCYKTNNPKGTPAYIDPEFLSTGNLTPMSDVYSFGIVLLQLLTGRPPLGIAKEVQLGLDGGSLGAMLDTSAGNWPFVQAKQIACLGLRCCERNRENRPDLISQVWKVFEPMKASWYSVE